MKNLLRNALLLLSLAPAALAQSFSANLTGAAEVPGPGDPDGVGVGVVTVDGTNIRYSVLAQNIGVPTLAHIHRGAAGVSGPPVVTLNVATLASGVSPVSAELANEITSNPSSFYLNVHTADFPNGAVRGQLVSAAAGGERVQFLPVVGKVAGNNNTNFVTDLRIINRTGSTAAVTLDFFVTSGAGLNAPTVTRTVTVAPGEQKVLDDVLGATLQTSGLGALRITSDQSVTVTSRVINDLRGVNAGTTGFSVNSVSPERAATAGTISFLSQASGADIAGGAGFRTNLGYFNPSSSPVNVTFTARRSDTGAVLGSSSVAIAGWSMVQQSAFGLIGGVPEADRTQPDFYVTWTAEAPVYVYGSVVDNKTGDSVLMQ